MNDHDRQVPAGRSGLILVAVRDHDRGVHVQHSHAWADVPSGRPRHRYLTHQRPYPCPGPGDASPLRPADLVQRPPTGRWRSHRPEHFALVTQNIDVSDRPASVGDHHRQIGQYPAPVVDRPPVAPAQRRLTTRRSTRHGRPASAAARYPLPSGTPRPSTSAVTHRCGGSAFLVGAEAASGRIRCHAPVGCTRTPATRVADASCRALPSRGGLSMIRAFGPRLAVWRPPRGVRRWWAA
jgi:hypothetical protein